MQPVEEVDICAVHSMRSLLLDVANPARELTASPFVLRTLSGALLGPSMPPLASSDSMGQLDCEDV